MRISELLALQWGDIDGEAQIIHLNGTWVYGEIDEGRKENNFEPIERCRFNYVGGDRGKDRR
jgi:integrase